MSKQITGKLIVITGKTASGKDTIISKILTNFPNLKRIVTTTSRAMREGERDGVDYHFISRDEFKQKMARGELLEYVEYGGNYYGTEKSRINLGENLIWKIDPSMAGKAKQLFLDSISIYITVNNQVVLQRLRERGLSEEEIAKRMADDAKIWDQYKNNYDFIIENVPGKLDEAVAKIINILQMHALQ